MSDYISLPNEKYSQIMGELQEGLKASRDGSPESKAIQNAIHLLNKYSCWIVCPSVRPSVTSISVTAEEVGRQIELDSFGMFERREAAEVCYIIAEVMASAPELPDGRPRTLKINGAHMNIQLVQEVFRSLTYEHVQLVIENFKQITSRIYNKRAYLHTALYNSVFELDLHYTNLVKHDMGF